MEGAENVVVVPVDPGWSDVGGWAALYELGDKDEDANVLVGDVVGIDIRRNYIRTSDGKRVSISGLSDLVVVVEGDDILILPRERAQDVKLLAQKRSASSEEHTPELHSLMRISTAVFCLKKKTNNVQ